MKTKTFTVHSPAETMAIAQKLGSVLSAGSVLTLEGDLAAGKTTFAKGLAVGVGISDVIDSPTFAIVKEYDGGRLPLFHMDVYRLDGDSDVEFVLEYFDRGGVCVIEWASNIAADLPDQRIDVRIERLDGEGREISIFGFNFKEEEMDHVNVSD
ncbi:MAG: tRNA (adenosine(37)-N6)-threonylcarbamoyltransferase complex ATPase subunit type 1 TsaE [Turicibacter sp.]|nr:tRNA (adenosine(37)-N6)-threonylcarbamoyltransferase complex ATPase subunit type 1 TsaE [Turicibacter sp.]